MDGLCVLIVEGMLSEGSNQMASNVADVVASTTSRCDDTGDVGCFGPLLVFFFFQVRHANGRCVSMRFHRCVRSTYVRAHGAVRWLTELCHCMCFEHGASIGFASVDSRKRLPSVLVTSAMPSGSERLAVAGTHLSPLSVHSSLKQT